MLWFPTLYAQGNLLHPPDSDAPRFEVSTIRPSKDIGPMRIELSASNFNAVDATLKDLISFAFDVRSEAQIEGLPSWARSEHFDVHAKASDQEIRLFQTLPILEQTKQIREMMQALVSERFDMKMTFKSKTMPSYALVIAKGGSKMRQSPPSFSSTSPGAMRLPGAHMPSFGMTGHDQYTATSWDMHSLAEVLSRFQELDHRVVVDETGLKGQYDFVLNGVSALYSPDNSTTSIFTALREQLGLKLEPREFSVEVLVVESASMPSAN
jgi:uncharacterized protein (TIGR03435 family)